MDSTELLELIESLQSMTLDQATGTTRNQWEYAQARNTLMENNEIKPLLPRWIRTYGTLTSFEQFMKTKYASYAERRQFIRDGFAPLIAKLEGEYVSVIDTTTAETLEQLGFDHVQDSWRRALGRVHAEPDAAITSARTMLENLFKSLLDQRQIEYAKDADLPKLYRLLAEKLQFTPEQQADQSLKTVSGNIQSIVGQLAFLRNNFSDAHGQGQNHYEPSPELAEFVVNLAGSLAVLITRLYLSQ